MDRITLERIYIPSVEQANAINAAADKEVTRESMAQVYRDCIIAHLAAKGHLEPGVDFKAVNEAITKRWPKGLNFIKTRAWKLLERKDG